MIPDEILSEYRNLAERQNEKLARVTGTTHEDALPRFDWVTGKLLEIIHVQEQRIDELERRVNGTPPNAGSPGGYSNTKTGPGGFQSGGVSPGGTFT